MEKRRLVFISHANPEDNDFASWLGTRLTAMGYKVWTDVLRLKGGEAFWRDIGTVIRKKAIVVIVALSRASYQKDGVLNEIALSINAGQRLNKQKFVIPVRLDDLPFSDFPEQLIRLNAIDFSLGWADGFSKLIEIFNDTEIPRSTRDFGEGLADWQKFRLQQSTPCSNTSELLLSNWFQIRDLPSEVNFSRFKAPQRAGQRAWNKFQSPVAPYRNMIVSFADTPTIQKENPNVPIEHVARISRQQFLEGRVPDGSHILWRDAYNMLIRLLRDSWEKFLQNRGLLRCEFAHGSAWFVPLDLLEGNIATFHDENSRKRKRRLVGRSETRQVYWNLGVSGQVSIVDPPHLVFRLHVVFTKEGKTPLDNKSRVALLRRSFCKNWWNARWRDMLRAFVAFLANDAKEFSLPLGGDAEAVINASPMSFYIPLSIADNVSATDLTEESHAEDETEADALDDGEFEGMRDVQDDDAGATM